MALDPQVATDGFTRCRVGPRRDVVDRNFVSQCAQELREAQEPLGKDELDRKAGLPDWRELEGKVKAAIEGAHTQCTCDACMTLEAREVVVQLIKPLLCEMLSHHNDQLRKSIEAIEGLKVGRE